MNEPLKNEVNIRRLSIRLSLSLGLLFLLVVVLGSAAREPIELVSIRLVEEFGVVGLFVGVLCIDSIPGLTNEPLLLLGLSGGLGYFSILVSAGLGSVAGGVLGWFIGGRLGGIEAVRSYLERSGVTGFFQVYGGRAIVIAALLPVPFALMTWAAGAAGLDFRTLLLGALWRIPKTWFYLTLIQYGWGLGA